MLVIVPNSLRDAINKKLDEALEACPEAEVDRKGFYNFILSHFNEHGVIPEFTLSKRGSTSVKENKKGGRPRIA